MLKNAADIGSNAYVEKYAANAAFGREGGQSASSFFVAPSSSVTFTRLLLLPVLLHSCLCYCNSFLFVLTFLLTARICCSHQSWYRIIVRGRLGSTSFTHTCHKCRLRTLFFDRGSSTFSRWPQLSRSTYRANDDITTDGFFHRTVQSHGCTQISGKY